MSDNRGLRNIVADKLVLIYEGVGLDAIEPNRTRAVPAPPIQNTCRLVTSMSANVGSALSTKFSLIPTPQNIKYSSHVSSEIAISMSEITGLSTHAGATRMILPYSIRVRGAVGSNLIWRHQLQSRQQPVLV